MPVELSNLELGLELELNSDDVAAAEAAVAAHGELLTCRCCNQELPDKESLHLHHISQHSVAQLSIALLTLQGFDLSSGLGGEGPKEMCCEDSESESTVSAHSAFMTGFTDEFSNAVPEVCAENDLSETNGFGQVQCAALSYASQLSACAGNYSYGESGSSQDGLCVDMNSNHESTSTKIVKSIEQDLYHTISKTSLTRSSGDISTTSSSPKPAAFQNKLSEVEMAEIQPKCGNNFQCIQSKTTRKVAMEGTRGPLTNSKEQLFICTDKSSTKKSEKERSGDDCDRREFSCDICGRKYKRKSHLGRHIRMHSGVRPYPCTVCDKRFAVRSILKQHMRVHTGERPFKCHYCFQGFPQKSGLVTHMMLHTGKPYKCDQCAKSFVSNHKLAVHKRSHEEQSGRWPMWGPHSCPTCSTRFFTNSALLEHANVHIGAPLNSPIAQPAASNVAADDGAGPGCETPNAANMKKHNSQEVTAGQALLTLMDSNGTLEDSALGDEEYKEDNISHSEDSENDAPDVAIDFEFCDVPLDLKSAIYMKEECFDLDSVLKDSSANIKTGDK